MDLIETEIKMNGLPVYCADGDFLQYLRDGGLGGSIELEDLFDEYYEWLEWEKA